MIKELKKGQTLLVKGPARVELIDGKIAHPGLVIGLPVGFVNAAESKEALMKCDIPYISNIGRKGGSNIAASVVNALTKLAMRSL